MSLHSYVKIFVHVIWGVKNREKILLNEIRPIVEKHLLEYAYKNGIEIEVLSVQSNHVHALIDLSSTHRLEDVMHLLKGESSHWMNAEILPGKFSWQRGYGAFSVSISDRGRVRAYIENQDEHHRGRPFAEEYQAFLRNHGFAASDIDEQNR